MIYLDNAATSWPKPVEVTDAVVSAMKYYGANPGRSGHKMAIRTIEKVYECRELVSDFFGLNNPGNVIFTQNATHALNLAINGILQYGDHVICTVMDHNSVLRPLYARRRDIDVSFAEASVDGTVDIEHLKSLIKPNTKMIVMTHVSNVCGTIMPVEEVGNICRDNNILFLLDASQSAGVLNIDMQKMNIDFLAAPGHKSLYGPMGTGVLCVNSDSELKPLITGGTGSYSHELSQPSELPDRFESGTLNVMGICGLAEGIRYVNRIGINNIFEHELKLSAYLLGKLSQIDGITVNGKIDANGRTGVVSFTCDKSDSVSIAEYLSSSYSIATRASYHCAYLSHCALGTSDGGSVRVSPGIFNTMSEIKMLVYALKNMQ
ncbi:MAG: aminotransferase class V-fold PLP-dependent enzyme [Ruminococcaceae bacterium]|nr:aminotransferase class V-fold PLP-dependent enzyme [Oscillospiraceae bacterium]